MNITSSTQDTEAPEYQYNADDKLMHKWALNFTNRMGDGTGDHEIAYLDMLNLLIELKRDGAMMDIGGGLGRVTEMATGKISEIVVLEPDLKRFEYCHRAFHDPPTIQVLNQLSSTYIRKNPEKKFDLVVLGMVIQHISTTACNDIIKDVARLLKADGVAIISTTLVPECAQGFSYSNTPHDAYVPREEFDRYAECSRIQDKGIPVRRFTEAELRSAVESDFDILQWTQFSYYRREKIAWFAKIFKTRVRDLQDVGNSQFVVVRRRS